MGPDAGRIVEAREWLRKADHDVRAAARLF